MDLFIRDIDVAYIKKIDELSRKKGISRNSYIKNLIKNFCIQKEISNYEKDINETMLALKLVLEKNIDTLKRVEMIIGDGSED